MPVLNRFDNYHECLGTYGDEAVYCVADTFTKPDESSELYKLIVKYSSDTKKHYRHDNLVRGLCVNTCKEKIAKLGYEAEKYFVEKFPIDSKARLSLMLIDQKLNSRSIISHSSSTIPSIISNPRKIVLSLLKSLINALTSSL